MKTYRSINRYGTRTHHSYDSYGKYESSYSDTVVCGKVIKYRETAYSTNHHKPLPYTIATIEYGPGTSTQTKKTYRYRSQPWGYHCDTQNVHLGNDHFFYNPPFHSDTGTSITAASGYDWSNLVNLSLARLNSAKVDSALILAEIGKTTDFLATATSTAARVLLDIKHLRWSKALKRLGINKKDFKSMKTPADALLKYRYAVRPLMMDVQNMWDIAQGSMVAELNRAYVVGKSKEVVNHVVKPPSGDGGWTHESTLTHRVGIYAQIECPEMAGVKHLTSINPALIAWELVPFSFVVDWFLPIGELLSASTALVGLKNTEWYKSTKIETKSTYSIYPEDSSSSLGCPLYSGQSGTSRGSVKSFQRFVEPNGPIVTFPSVKQGLSSSLNIATALALLNNLRK